MNNKILVIEDDVLINDILTSSRILLSYSITSILTYKMEGIIKASLSQVMNSTSESIKFKIQSSPNDSKELVFKNDNATIAYL